MMKLVVFVFLVALAVASAQYLAYGPAYAASGAYGVHNIHAISSQARVDAPRRDAHIIGALPGLYI